MARGVAETCSSQFYMYNLGFHSVFPKLGGAKYPLTQTMIIELGLLAAIVLVRSYPPAHLTCNADTRLAERSRPGY